jgi:D-alanyl-D-alanine carboxypeptidase
MYAWMAENCWQFGFILRYPDGKTDVTGIIYEPWHFRYVGLELAQELNQLGLTMEEYMDMLTEDAAAP